MNNCIRPRPGLFERWQLCLRGALIAFGVVALLGGATVALEPHSEPGELKRLRNLIENGNFTDYTLTDLRRKRELESTLDRAGSIDLASPGQLLLIVGLKLLAACALLMAAQNLMRWLWLGPDLRKANHDRCKTVW